MFDVWRLVFGVFLLFNPLASADESWRVWLEPKLMRPPVANPVTGSERTLYAAGMLSEGALVAYSAKEFRELKVEWVDFMASAQASAAADLAALTPRYIRNRKKVIEYAVLESKQPIVASAVLAPGFLSLFAETLGETVLLVVPNRSIAYVFPALASNHNDYWPMVFEAYRATPFPVSVEVFEVSAAGVKAVGVFQEP